MKPTPMKPRIIIAQVEGSGTGAMETESSNTPPLFPPTVLVKTISETAEVAVNEPKNCVQPILLVVEILCENPVEMPGAPKTTTSAEAVVVLPGLFPYQKLTLYTFKAVVAND